jgi:hypothetical protein
MSADQILDLRMEAARKTLKTESVSSLLHEAVEWDARECKLWFLTDGLVHPRKELGDPLGRSVGLGGAEGVNGRAGRVSVVTPTFETRRHFHPILWRVFEAQTWPDKELVVVEETYHDSPSSFFEELAKRDPRVVYVKYQRPKGQDWSIGLKRNLGAHFASGEYIVNFDDDDLYSPSYTTKMVTFLQDRNASAAKVCSWYKYDRSTSVWGFCDPISWGLKRGLDESSWQLKQWVFGYGFSYVFRRKAGLEHIYDDINLGEDLKFLDDLRKAKGEDSVALFHDRFGICAHIQHGANTSNSIPVLRKVDLQEVGHLDVMELIPGFDRCHGPSFSLVRSLLVSAEQLPKKRLQNMQPPRKQLRKRPSPRKRAQTRQPRRKQLQKLPQAVLR